jgi:FAD/FMN-containing dehydrogenase
MRGRGEETIAGWGGIAVPGRVVRSEDLAGAAPPEVLARGFGRSYGDSALPAPGVRRVVGAELADRILALDRERGVLRAEAGLALRDLVWTLLPLGLFPPVVPGTQFVTLGGMVAADVHGKNHHVDGTIGRHVRELVVLAARGERVTCSRTEHADLFRATLGGMGLTGRILEVELALARIPSPWIVEESVRVPDLASFLAALDAAARDWPFTVGWIDCLARGRGLGRGVLFRGRWAAREEAPAAAPRPRARLAVPCALPGWALGRLPVRIFNALYFRRFAPRGRRRVVHPETFFWPLDAVRHWNRIYGRRGFTQFQSVLPERERPGATARLLALAAERGGSSFLSVVKDCGAEGEGLLSFPRPGVSVALDLPITARTRALVEELADLVVALGGRVYLAKDAFVRADQFAAMEPRLAEFRRVRERWDPELRVRSAQSVRLLGDPPVGARS